MSTLAPTPGSRVTVLPDGGVVMDRRAHTVLPATSARMLEALDACEDELRAQQVDVTEQAWADLDRTRLALLEKED